MKIFQSLLGVSMAENMMTSAHKAVNQNYRDNYDETFRKDKKRKDKKDPKKDA